MAKNKSKTPTVITLTLPDEGGIQKAGMLLIQRGDLAKLYNFHYCNAGDITSAIQDATKAITALEKFPPVIPEASTPKTTNGKATKKTAPEPKDDEPTVDLPVKSGTVAVKISHLKIISGETDAAAYRRATLIGTRLIDAGLWDGQSLIRIEDAHATYARIKDLDDEVLGAMNLSDIVQVDETSDDEDADDPLANMPSSDDDGPHQLSIL